MQIRRNLFVAFRGLVRAVAGHGLGRFRVVRAAHRFLYRATKPSCVEVMGFKLHFDPKDRVMSHYLLEDRAWEPVETEALRQELRRGDVVVDVGANIGYYTILASRLVGEGGKVYAFEPEPDNFAMLQKNLKANGCTNVSGSVLRQFLPSDS